MKIRYTMKMPGAAEALADEIDNAEQLEQDDRDKVKDQVDAWFRWGEYVDIGYDTKADTMTVMRPNK